MAYSRTVVALSASASVEPPHSATRSRVGATLDARRDPATAKLGAPTPAERVQ